MTSIKVEFQGHDGARLDGRLELPLVEPRAYAVFAHCFTCGKNVLDIAVTSRGLPSLRARLAGNKARERFISRLEAHLAGHLQFRAVPLGPLSVGRA